MSQSKTKFILRLLLIAAAAVIFAAPPVVAAPTKEELDQQIKQQQGEYKKIQSKIATTKQKINEKKRQEKQVTQQLVEINQKIVVTQQRVNVVNTHISNVTSNINTVNMHISKVKNNISDLSAKIIVTKARIRELQGYLKSRFIAIYKYGGVTEFNLLLSAQGAEEAMSTTHMLSKLALQDQKMINELYSEQRKLKGMQDELRGQKSQLEGQNRVLVGKREELKSASVALKSATVALKSASAERNALLEKVRREKAIYIAQQEEFLKASRELQGKVQELVAAKKRMNQAKHPGKKETVYYKGGSLGWPLQGRGTINSTFGIRVHPIFKTRTMHTGVDLGAPRGTPVLAANDGEVLYCGWMRGYGQVVIIDHGGSLTTVYGHLSAITCKDDQKVDRGQMIGRVGATGVATGNHLHFEVRVNGKAVNPMGYIR